MLHSKIVQKQFIGIAFLAAQLEIAMRQGNVIVEFQQHIHQYHGIHAAAAGNKDGGARIGKVMLLYVCLDFTSHFFLKIQYQI